MKKHVLVITGGGTGTYDRLLSMGGASSWFLDGQIPYSKAALKQYLGYEPDKCCSTDTARKLAMTAFKRAISLGAKPEEAAGVSCTASLALSKDMVERENRRHTYFIGRQTHNTTECFSFCLHGLQSRKDEEDIVSDTLTKIIRGETDFPVADRYQCCVDEYKLIDIICGKSHISCISKFDTNPTHKCVIYSGSFNPIHHGHIEVINWCNKYLGAKPFLEISLSNVDKASLDFIDTSTREKEISESNLDIAGLIFSNSAKFIDKCQRYLAPTFLVGIDTYNRLFDVKYYKSVNEVERFAELCRYGNVKFFVLDRQGHKPYNGYIQRYDLQKVISFVPKDQYSDDSGISSTQIRKGKNNGEY